MSHARPRLVRVLAIGDSLTAGYHSLGTAYHPYGARLQALLNADGDGAAAVAAAAARTTPLPVLWEVEVAGVPAERADQVSRRLWAALRRSAYDVVVVMAGTNDVADVADVGAEEEARRAARGVTSALDGMYGAVLRSGAHLVVVNLPDVMDFGDATYFRRREWVREWIRERAEALLRSNAQRVSYVDAQVAVPYRGADAAFVRRHWDDGIHMKPAGYDLLADELFRTLSALPFSHE